MAVIPCCMSEAATGICHGGHHPGRKAEAREGVSVTILHTCGHERRHQYRTAQAAVDDAPMQNARACPECRERPKSDTDRAKVAVMARVRRAGKEER
jgi:hypothetical protein